MGDRVVWRWLFALVLGCATAVPVVAAAVSAEPVDAALVAPLYAGAAPGSEGWHWQERITPSVWGERWGRTARNVVHPTITVFKPTNPARATGATVIVVPGGAFRWLAIDNEGFWVARALAARGVTAVVLKYRLQQTSDDDEAFGRDVLAFMQNARAQTAAGTGKGALHIDEHPEANPALADTYAAIRYVRAHAAELGIDPHRVGLLGFSAGGFLVNALLMRAGAEARPDFAAQLYAGSAVSSAWPADLPPLFFAVAANDFLRDNVLAAYAEAAKTAKSVELHVYASGDHGFGATPQGLTSDLWFEEFIQWMSAIGVMQGGSSGR